MEKENPFIWHELVTSDQKKSGEFFCELLGWKTTELDAGEFGIYTITWRQSSGSTTRCFRCWTNLYCRRWHGCYRASYAASGKIKYDKSMSAMGQKRTYRSKN